MRSSNITYQGCTTISMKDSCPLSSQWVVLKDLFKWTSHLWFFFWIVQTQQVIIWFQIMPSMWSGNVCPFPLEKRSRIPVEQVKILCRLRVISCFDPFELWESRVWLSFFIWRYCSQSSKRGFIEVCKTFLSVADPHFFLDVLDGCDWGCRVGEGLLLADWSGTTTRCVHCCKSSKGWELMSLKAKGDGSTNPKGKTTLFRVVVKDILELKYKHNQIS